ncbi:hypothetical protein LMG24076_01332 [Trinickia soli]|nr:hypothetical protein LMG24076_01332 [Trinickia soli]
MTGTMTGTDTRQAGREGTVAVVGSLNIDLVVRVPRLPVAGETLADSLAEPDPAS